MAITAVSTTALERLRSAQAPVAVHSRFASGVNLRLGGVLGFAGPRAASGACGIETTAADASVLAAGERWQWQDDGFHEPGSRAPAIPVTAALRVYDPVVQPCGPVRPEILDLLEGLHETGEREDAPRPSAAGRSWFDDGDGAQWGMPRLRQAVSALVRWGRMPEEEGMTALHALVGLGVGLTPSGDDALVGAWCLCAAAGVTARPDAERLVLDPAGRPRTTDVSVSYLRLAAEGAFSPSLARVARCLTGPESDAADMADAVRAELRFGATSGADALAGMREAGRLLTAAPTTRPDG